LWRFEIRSYQPIPRDQPSSLIQHGRFNPK